MKTKKQGFTLLEILLVVTLIAAISGFAIMSVSSNPDQEIQKEAYRFKSLVEMAQEQALMRSEELGFSLEEMDYNNQEQNIDLKGLGYVFYKLIIADNFSWEVIKNNNLLRPYVPPPYVHMELEIENLPWQSKEFDLRANESLFDDDELFEADDQDIKEPEVLIYPSGQIMPFSLYFYSKNIDEPLYRVDGMTSGNLRLVDLKRDNEI